MEDVKGRSAVRLTLDDVTQSARADRAGIVLLVVAPPAIAPAGGGQADLTEVIKALGDGPLAPIALGLFVLGWVLLGTVVIVFVVKRRHRGANISGR